MEKLSNIIYTSALETYDLVEQNKKLIVQLITMFLPKDTRDFILKNEFCYEKYYSKSELEDMDTAMEIENQINKSNKKNTNLKKSETKTKNPSKKKTKNESIGLSKSINKSKVRAIMQYIPESLLNFCIFFSYLCLHSIYFWSILFIILFVTNIHYLLIGLFIAFVNSVGTVIFSNCPIFILEQKYRNKLTHNQHFMCNIIKKIADDQKHYSYEELMEQLIFVVFVILIKINLLILYRFFTGK
jgi:hypothetical protein